MRSSIKIGFFSFKMLIVMSKNSFYIKTLFLSNVQSFSFLVLKK